MQEQIQEKDSKQEQKKVFIKTYGCQMNVYDSEKMIDLMSLSGYTKTENIEEANLVILNTCEIREKASEKVYSELGRINNRKKVGKDFVITVAGCVSQSQGEQIFKRAPYVDIVVGPQSYHSLPKMVEEALENKKNNITKNRLIELEFVEEEKFDKLPEETLSVGASKFVSIQEGCDKFCTYCVVPYTRGAEFSRPIEAVYREVLFAVAKGAKEITLLGQNVNAYHGVDPEGNQLNLATLIRKISKINGLERIRYTTSYPTDMDQDLIDAHGDDSRLMPFLHLPIQSGSNKILKLMNRRYTREVYLDLIAKFRQSRPDIVFSSDFIVGFPGETDEDFEETIDIIEKVNYGQCYSFKYSPRPGTPAAGREQLSEEIKTKRLIKLQKLLTKQQLSFNGSCIGTIKHVLFDKDGKYNDQLIGKTEYMQSVHINAKHDDLYGKIIPVKIIAASINSLSGSIV